MTQSVMNLKKQTKIETNKHFLESKLISKLPSSNLGIANWGKNVLEDMNFSFF